jgi:hypothetical protein
MAFGLLLIIAVVALFSFYGALLINQGALQTIWTLESKDLKSDEVDTYSNNISKANKMVDFLTNDKGKLHYSSLLIDKIVFNKPSGVKIRSIDIGKNKEQLWSIILKGVSGNRNDLVAFTTSLKKDPLFSSVDSPFSNLIKGGGSDFSIIITLSSELIENKK